MLTSRPSTRPHTVKASFPSPAEVTWLQSGRDPWEWAAFDSSGVHTLKFDLCSIPNRRNGSLIETKSKMPSCCLFHPVVAASFSHSPAPVFVHISWSSYIDRHTLLIHNGDLNIERSHQPPFVCLPGSTCALTVPNMWRFLFYATVNACMCVSPYNWNIWLCICMPKSSYSSAHNIFSCFFSEQKDLARRQSDWAHIYHTDDCTSFHLCPAHCHI